MANLGPSRRSERGAALVITVIWLPVLLLFFMFVVDVGNWFMHKRHLQLQADAGALAGGGAFGIPCSDTRILAATRKYAGDPNASGPYNLQVKPTNQANVHALVNSSTYWNKGGADYTDGGQPCTTKFIDVKMTEANLPWWMRLSVVPAINAHARVSILQKQSAFGSLPIAVPDARPRDAAAFVINESTQAILASGRLTNEGPATMNGKAVTKWDGTLASFDLQAPNIGVVYALSGTVGFSIAGSLSTICAQSLVVCYSGTTSFQGLTYIRGYSTTATGTPTAPVLRDVSLFSAGGTPCGDTSAPSFVLNGNCTLGVRAKILWGADTTPPAAADVRVANYSCPSGGNPKGCHMTYHTTGPDAGYWTTQTTGEFPLFPSGAGPQPIDFNWQTGTGGNKISGIISAAQRVFSATLTGSGPIQFAQTIADSSSIGPTTLPFGTHTFSVAIGVAGNLQNDSHFNDPTTVMRVADPSGSQNFAIDCDPAPRTFRDEIATGCATEYQINTGQACPNATLPLNCAAIETGDKVGQLRQGMNDRFAACPTNHWTNPGDPTQMPDIQPGDPRAIPVILVPFGSFKGSGSGWVPITDFGTFYVTGWDYTGNTAPCPDNEPPPAAISTDHKGDIWGHFIKYVDSINTGGTGGSCDFSSFGTCVAVLTE